MTAKSAPTQQAKPGTLAFVIAAAILSTMVVMCGGLVVGVMFYLAKRAVAFNRRVDAAIQQVQQISGSPAVSPPMMAPGVNDWWVQRSLAPVYTAAIDAVALHPDVVERLGEPVEPLEDAEELYRVMSNGAANSAPPGSLPGSQTIEFDIKGPKGAAVVSVKAATDNAQLGGTYRATEITVKFNDGTEVDVPPPKEQAGTVIQ